MQTSIPTPYILLFPITLALGWSGTRMSLHIHHTKGSRGDRLAMLIVGWGPLLAWLLALLISLVEKTA